ncbi:MAG: hypothetical protein J6C85_01200, partial [Alphaproteobacteria bacterium]|nr:hypothetical protein [Alphaproteobacteria bacterium]
DFKNFELFLEYSRQHVEDMKSWSPEKMKEYTDNVMALRKTDPEFKAQYDKWTRNLENKQKKTVIIGGNEKDTMCSKALLKLKKIKQKYQTEQHRQDIVAVAKRKKEYSI